MENDELSLKLNEFTNNQFDFILRSADLHKDNSCDVTIAYKDGAILNKEKRSECTLFLLELLPEGYIYNIKFIKNYISDETIEDFCSQTIKNSFPALVYEFNSAKLIDGIYNVNLSIDELVLDYVKSKNVVEELQKALEKNFLAKFVLKIGAKENLSEFSEDVFEEVASVIEKPRVIDINEISALCGEKVNGPATYIKDHKIPQENVVLCGKVKFIKSYECKKKAKVETPEKEEPTEANEEQKDSYVRKFFRFVLADFTSEVSCIYFANKTTIAAAEKIAENSEIIVSGDLEEDKYTGGLSLKVKNISLCILPKEFKEVINYKPLPDRYHYVTPTSYVQKQQVDLFSVMAEVEPEVPEYLKNNDVVVFDFETTGLSATDCKIIEIGAVKIHNGKITEQFETFINPEEHIPEDSTKIHGIVDKDVMDAPVYTQALQDFYKFTYNCTLVAYNIAFDYSFLSLYGKNAGYNFNNKQIDALRLATRNVKGVKNYKLKTIADKLGVLLDNAHRAVYDAIATAEVFIKLAKFIEV